MHIYRHSDVLLSQLSELIPKTIGLVPTMGALHKGHLSLIEKAVSENDWVIVTIFVNPTQFDSNTDLVNYPSNLEQDLELLSPFGEKLLVYTPRADDLYGEKAVAGSYQFDILEKTMEGASRSGHFQGVATVVHKLLSVFKPTKAYFGEKDYQQLQIIHALVAQLKLPVTIVDCPIVREIDGLAMSSRNTRLTPIQRAIAPVIYETLCKAVALKKQTSILQINEWVTAFFREHPHIELDYFCVANNQTLQLVEETNGEENLRAFIAVKLGEVRLIDNVKF